MDRFGFSLSYKALLSFLIILFPILVVFLITFRINKISLEDHVMDDLRLLAEDREGDMLLFIEMLKNRIQDFSTDGSIRVQTGRIIDGDKGAVESLSSYLQNVKLPITKSFYRLSVISPQGKVIASTLRSSIGLDVAGEEYFIQGKLGTTFIDRTPGYRGEAELAVATPILDRENRLAGVLVGVMPLDRFTILFSGELAKELGALTAGSAHKTLEVYIVNRDKLMLVESRFTKDTVMKQVVDTLPVRECLEAGREIRGAYYKDYRGVDVAGASMCFPYIGWTMLVEMDKSEILAPVIKTANYGVFTLIITVGLITMLFLMFLRLVVKQLEKLAAAAVEIAGGNYDIAIPVRSSDELGMLADSFNNMAIGIRERDFAIRQSEARFEGIIDNTINVIYLKDGEGRYILINRRYEEIFGISRREIAGKTDYDLFPNDAAKKFRENDIRAMGSPSPIEFEERVPQTDGVHTYISVKFGLKDPKGNVYAVCGVSTDITERIRTEEALRESEHSLENAQRIAHIGNWDWNIVKNEVRWSDEMYGIFGVAPGEFGATYETFLPYVHPDDREYVQNAVNGALSYNKPYSIDYRIILPDGTQKIVHSQAETVLDEAGKPVRLTGTLQDITVRKRAEDEVRRLNEELEKRVAERTAELEVANRELESFSYSVAHDLRSPLRVIEGFSKILIDDYVGKLDKDGIAHLNRVRSASQRMSELIADLLELSNVTRSEMKKTSVDLSSIARGITDELVNSEPERRCEFMIEEGLKGYGDEGLLRVALENLLGNAWKFTGKKPEARIEFGSSGEKDGKAVYFIRDNGAGFDMRHRERLFGAFQRLHPPEEFPGTGVGLATVQRIVQRHGGSIWAEAEPGKGATFYFTL